MIQEYLLLIQNLICFCAALDIDGRPKNCCLQIQRNKFLTQKCCIKLLKYYRYLKFFK